MTVLEKILSETQSKSIADLKIKLKSLAKFECGNWSSEIKLPSFKVYYTDNDYHFCEFGIAMKCVGFTNALALDAQSITVAGKKRGCGSHYLKKEFLRKTIEI